MGVFCLVSDKLYCVLSFHYGIDTHLLIIIPPANIVWGGYIGIGLSVCADQQQEILIQLVYIICGFDEHDLRIIRVTQKMADDKTETIDLINKTIQLILSWSGIQNCLLSKTCLYRPLKVYTDIHIYYLCA
jgi:hypothetical protein